MFVEVLNVKVMPVVLNAEGNVGYYTKGSCASCFSFCHDSQHSG